MKLLMPMTVLSSMRKNGPWDGNAEASVWGRLWHRFWACVGPFFVYGFRFRYNAVVRWRNDDRTP